MDLRRALVLGLVTLAGCGLQPRARSLAAAVDGLCDADAVPFRPVVFLGSRTAGGAPRGHSSVAVYDGLLIVPYGVDGGRPGGGIEVYDLSTPACPTLVARVDEPGLREAHGFAFSGSLAVFQSVDGIQFWDLSDPRRPRLARRLPLPGLAASDYDLGAWWVTWQAPYIYVAGSANGLCIVDAADVATAHLVRRVDPTHLGNFRVGQVFVRGDLMVLAANDQPGLATLDLSDPTRPLLLAATRQNPRPYSSLLAGDRVLGAGRDGALHVFDVSDPRRLGFVGSSPVAAGNGKGGYVSVQDDFAHVGFSSQYAKIDLRDLRVAGTASSRLPGRDEDFATVIGNLVFAPAQAPASAPAPASGAAPASGHRHPHRIRRCTRKRHSHRTAGTAAAPPKARPKLVELPAECARASRSGRTHFGAHECKGAIPYASHPRHARCNAWSRLGKGRWPHAHPSCPPGVDGARGRGVLVVG